MFPKIPLFPLVTTSRNRFIEHIVIMCESNDIEGKNYKKKKWVKRVKSEICEAHYFVGVIFIEKKSSYLIFHELIHHISAFMRGYTQAKIWYNLDYLIDGLDIFWFRK